MLSSSSEQISTQDHELHNKSHIRIRQNEHTSIIMD